MIQNIRIRQVCTDTLSCEPIVRRVSNGELLCLCQCGGPREPDPANRVYAFHSADNGDTWSKRELIRPEDGRAVYCTEVTVEGEEITAYLTVHTGRFLDWQCVMYKSSDCGYTWYNAGSPPYFPEYTFIRGQIHRRDGGIVLPYQFYPVPRAEHDRVLADPAILDKKVSEMRVPYCESGVLISENGGKEYIRYPATRFGMEVNWVWSEPTVVELESGELVMLMRRDRSWCLWECRSSDGGKTWSEAVATDIPNPPNKPKLIRAGDKIALLHTPNATWRHRYPLALWLSEDGMKTWKHKIVLSDFPGKFYYCDGIWEDGHILFTVEHNRHTVLFFDVALADL